MAPSGTKQAWMCAAIHTVTRSPLPHIRDVRLCLWRKLRSNSCSVRPGDAPAIIRAVASYKNTRRSADWKCQLQETCNAWVMASRPLRSTKQPIPITYWSADKSLAWPSQCILFDGENISFDASLVIYIYIHSTNIPPIMIINRIYETQNLLSL